MFSRVQLKGEDARLENNKEVLIEQDLWGVYR